MDNGKLLKVGVAGTVITAICCATPILVVVFGALGLGAWVGGLDYVLLPLLVVFVGICSFALFQRYRGKEQG